MANNCCSGNECEELVTIGYMRSITSSTSVNFPCIDVSDAEGYDNCCEADESAYTPTYGDIMIEVSPNTNKGKYANIRKIDIDDPIRDINGFSARTTSTPIESCCGELDPNDALIPKSDFLFGWTVIKKIDFLVEKDVSICDPSYRIKETNTYNRCIYSCDFEEAEGAYVNISPASSVSYISGRLPKHYSEMSYNSCSATCNVSFDDVTISTSITTCNVTETAETSFTLNQYEVIVGLLPYDGNNGSIPCEGGELTLNYDDICGEISYGKPSAATSSEISEQTLIDELELDDGKITIGENTNGYSEVYIHLPFSIGDKDGKLVCRYDWSLCSIPIEPSDSCNPYWGEINFDGVVKPENLHDRGNCGNEWTN